MKKFVVGVLLVLVSSISVPTEASLVKLTQTTENGVMNATAAMERALAEHFAKCRNISPERQKLAARYRAVLADAHLLPAERRSELFEVLEAVRDSLVSARQQDLTRVGPEEVPRFLDDGDVTRLAAAVDRSIAELARHTNPLLPFGARLVKREDVLATLVDFRLLLSLGLSREELDRAVRARFDIYRSPGKYGSGGVLYTAYNDPVFEGALKPDATYRYPLYRPPELARLPNGRFDRAQIDRGALARRGLELAWLKHPAEAYLLELEGSGLLKLAGGRMLRVRYAADNGRHFVGLGSAVEKDGLLAPAEVARAQGRKLYVERPDLALAALEKNPRVIFFDAEPIAATGQELDLSPGRSVAVDTGYFPRGGLGFMCLDRPEFTAANVKPRAYQPVTRFLVNQDTGAAIRGPGRIDIYWGFDHTAQLAAGQLRQPGSLFYLLRKGTALVDAKAAVVLAKNDRPAPAARARAPVMGPRLARLPARGSAARRGPARAPASGAARHPKGS